MEFLESDLDFYLFIIFNVKLLINQLIVQNKTTEYKNFPLINLYYTIFFTYKFILNLSRNRKYTLNV